MKARRKASALRPCAWCRWNNPSRPWNACLSLNPRCAEKALPWCYVSCISIGALSPRLPYSWSEIESVGLHIPYGKREEMRLKGLPYFLGIAVTKCITAVLFVFQPGKSRDRVLLDACTGWVRHMGRFYESRAYAFVLDTNLSKGNVEVSLLDKRKQPLLRLTGQSPAQVISLDGKSRYYIRWDSVNFAGKIQVFPGSKNRVLFTRHPKRPPENVLRRALSIALFF